MTRRLAAIIRADFLMRFRRLSTVVLFLLLSAIPYLWIPDPSTGRALMRVGRARVLYNSAAIGIATAMLASIFIGLAGFYVISNAIRRDVQSRCGFVLASTNVRSGEYLLGKVLGNVFFLATFTFGFMLTSMAMLIVRGEAPLEPWTFVKQYLILVPSTIAMVAALAITFEAIPLLSGRFGDVVYFFLWTMMMAMPAMFLIKGVGAIRYFDVTGLGFLFEQIRQAHHTQSISIGAGPFDRALPLVVMKGLTIGGLGLVQRLTSTFLPLLLFPVALLFFHRFDPARVRAAGASSRRGWGARFSAMAKPFVRPFTAAAMRGRVFADVAMTFAAQPVAGIVLIAIAIASIASAESLPISFALAAIFVADVASRDARAGTLGLIHAAPHLRERFVLWKVASTTLTALVILFVPVARAAATRPDAAIQLVLGIVFIGAAAAALGAITSNPKAFIVVFLSFWYIVVNDKGATLALNFAGWYGRGSLTVSATYAAIALVLDIAAEVTHRARLVRA